MSGRKYIASDGSELKPGMMVLVFGCKDGYEDGTWFVDVFSHAEPENDGLIYFCASRNDYKVCVPLEGYEHLAGTNLSFKENVLAFHSDAILGWGDVVSVSNDGKAWFDAVFICYGSDVRKFIVIEHGFMNPTSWKMCKLVKK